MNKNIFISFFILFILFFMCLNTYYVLKIEDLKEKHYKDINTCNELNQYKTELIKNYEIKLKGK